MTDLTELRTFADYHRELADKADALILAMEADPKGTPTAVEEPRYYVQQINGMWGVRDRQVEGEWAAFDEYDSSDADETAASLNAGESRSAWDWTATGTY